MGVRDESRARTTAAILAAARHELAQRGAAGLSMREVARQVELVSSAVYRYFPSRDALITAMVIESYQNLATTLSATPPGPDARRWENLANALRAWAREFPHEFQLIYGTPIPGYAAPAETIAAAAAVAEPFLLVGAQQEIDGFGQRALAGQMLPLVESFPAIRASGAAAVLAELAALVGFLTLELAGHFVGLAEPADPLFNALIGRQIKTLALT